jgi:hypothetical protein
MSETAWISVGDLGKGFTTAHGSACLPPTGKLAGKRLVLHFEDGSAADYRFESASELVRSVPRSSSEHATARPAAGGFASSASMPYRATEVRPDILFVDSIEYEGAPGPGSAATSLSLILDLGRGICTRITGTLPGEADARVPPIDRIARGLELTGVGAEFLSGAIGRPFTAGTERHGPTRELIGKRVEYTYSDAERYEHIYLNDQFYTWHCLAGSEQGLADTDRCRYLKIAERLYCFVWREKIVPTLGAVLVDLGQMRTTGKIFGYQGFDFGAVVNFPVGARARIVNGS